MKRRFSFLTLLQIVIAFLIVGCDSENPSSPFSSALKTELKLAKLSTQKYYSIRNAKLEGYTNANEHVPHMGDHYVNMNLLLDGKFEVRKPELLVYDADSQGGLHLLAVEYAVLLSDYPNSPPEGFTGNEDVWFKDEDHGLWTLHAWIWYDNPDGIFEPFNPRVE